MTTTTTPTISDFAMAVEAEAVAAKQIAAHHRCPPVPSDLLMPVMAGVLAGAR